MPTYPHNCPTCGTQTDLRRSVADRDNAVPCVTDGCPGTLQRAFCTQVHCEAFIEVALTETQFAKIEAACAERIRAHD